MIIASQTLGQSNNCGKSKLQSKFSPIQSIIDPWKNKKIILRISPIAIILWILGFSYELL